MCKIKIYRDTCLSRKLHLDAGYSTEIQKRDLVFYKELERRGFKNYQDEYSKGYDVSGILKEVDSRIQEKVFDISIPRDYSILDLSLLNLIEAMISMSSAEEIDLIKLEVLFVLFENLKIFPKNDEVLALYFKRGLSLFESIPRQTGETFLLLEKIYLYLFDIGKMLVSKCRHDYLINKKLKKEIILTPTKGYNKKYQYFSEVQYYFF